MAQATTPIAVYLEIGQSRTFATALDWPGWSRSGRDEASALQTLYEYGPRYARALETAGLGFRAPSDPAALVVVERDGAVREANATALAVLGRETAEGDFADLFLAEAERAEGRQTLRAAFAAPAGEAAPFVSGSESGDCIRWTVLPLAGPDGEVDALLLAGERAEPSAAAVAIVSLE